MSEKLIPTEILTKYKSLIRSLGTKVNNEEKKDIKKAFEVAYTAHKNVKRKSGEAYIFHPLSVAKIVAKEIGLGKLAITCALLHDVVEDSEIKLNEIEKKIWKKSIKYNRWTNKNI